MALTLAELVAPKTTAQMRQQLLDALQGRGVVTKTGTGTGSLSVSGAPTASYSVQVRIAAGGEPGAATFQYSLDGGASWSEAATIPASGATGIGTTGASVTFAAGPSGAGTSFVAGDLFSFSVSTPTFPATSWQEGSVPRSLIEIDAQELADLTSLVAVIARGSYVTAQPGVTGADGAWLDLAGQNVYGLTRQPAVATVGVVTLTDASNAGPFNISPGQLWVGATASLSTTTPLRFLNTTGGTLPQGGTLAISVAAELPGAAYNVANGAITTLLTNLPGVTVANSPGSGSWITQQGTDVESDLAYATRCMNRWPSVGIGATAASYDYWARTASAEVTRTKVQASGSVGGQVDIWVAGSSGPVSGAALTAVQNYIAPRLPVGTTQNTANASALAITIAGTVNVLAANLASAQAEVAANLQALLAATPIGGTLYLSQVIEALNTPTGVRNSSGVTINTVAADLVLTASQVAGALTNSITWVSI